MNVFIAQLAAPPAGAIENVALALAAIAALVLLGRKLFPRGINTGDFVSKPEFRDLSDKVDGLRDKIDGRLVALADRVDRVGDSLHRRLNDLEAGLARVDERTRK